MYSYALLGSGVSGNVGSDLVNRGGAARAILKTEVSLDGVHNRLRLDGIEAPNHWQSEIRESPTE